MRTRATYSWMLAVFAGLALILALGGTYGVTSYLVSHARARSGFASPWRAVRRHRRRRPAEQSVLDRVGSRAGLVASIFVAAQVGELFFGVSPRDPSVLADGGCAGTSGDGANWIPARRGARIRGVVARVAGGRYLILEGCLLPTGSGLQSSSKRSCSPARTSKIPRSPSTSLIVIVGCSVSSAAANLEAWGK